MLKMYGDRFCSHTRALQIVMHEVGIPHQWVHLPHDAPRPPEISDKTPPTFGGPVLFVRSDFVLWESNSIIYWITHAYPCSVTSSSLDAQAKSMAWIEWSQRFLYQPLAAFTDSDLSAKRDAEHRFRALLPALEPSLPDADQWLVSNEFSTADIAMAPPLVALPATLVESLPPKIGRYIDRLRHRPSVHAVCELGEVDSRPSWAA